MKLKQWSIIMFFDIVNREKIPFNQNPILAKCLFKSKNDFRYREILVAFGFQKNTGIDFYNSHSPVMHYIWTMLLIIVLNEILSDINDCWCN